MSLLNDQRRRKAQILQQVKELARQGQWQEAKSLIDTLPDAPDVTRIRERIGKQLFVATGEVPTVMEGGLAVADMDEDTAWIEGSAQASKIGHVPDEIPTYAPIRFAAFVIYGVGAITGGFSVLLLITAFVNSDSSGVGTSIAGIVSGLFIVASSAMMPMFIDIARNSFISIQLLKRIADKDNEQPQ